MPSNRKRYEKDQKELIERLQSVQDAKELGPQQALSAFEKFRIKLERLIAHEEKIVFPHFDEAKGLRKEGPTAVMRVEHQQIRFLLDKIGEKLLQGNMATDAEQIVLSEILRSHQQHERTVVYPTMDQLP